MAAWFVTAVEILGGAALVLGVLTPVAGALNMVSLLGAIVLVHAQNGGFVQTTGSSSSSPCSPASSSSSSSVPAGSASTA